MVEGAPLLREYTRKGIVGSNPIFSATLPKDNSIKNLTLTERTAPSDIVSIPS